MRAVRPAAYPILAAGERAIAEATLGGDTAVLTDRRLVVAGRDYEQSLPLAQIGFVRVHFERAARAVAIGVALIALAALLFAVTSPLRTVLLNQSVALESAAAQERAASPDGEGNIASGIQRLLGALAAAARMLPVAGWLLLLGGLAKIALGVIGRTVVTVAASGSEIAFASRGRNRALHEFVTEVGRHLPAPRRIGDAARTD